MVSPCLSKGAPNDSRIKLIGALSGIGAIGLFR